MLSTDPSSTVALIVAAGRGVRAGGYSPKQYRKIGSRPVLGRTLEPFLAHPAIGSVQVVIGSGDAEQYITIAPQHERLLPPVVGGATRQQSVLAGLRAVEALNPARILIHDAARPFVGNDLISRVVGALDTAEAAVPVLAVASTLKSIDADGKVTSTIPRHGIYAAETPQGFRFDRIMEAHRRAAAEGHDFTDDAGVAEWAGIQVQSVMGDPRNVKLTSAGDVETADQSAMSEALLRLGDVRVGIGYDVHVLGPGSEVMLGGIAIPHNGSLVGHSDADVALHALTDAILGALADGDIGVHFPPSDPKWRGASSDRFLADAVERVARRGGVIAHLDLAILAEAPKIGPHRDAMRNRIAAICGVGVDRIAVKATTNEKLGFVGRGEGIAAYATATIRLPFRTSP